MTEVGDDRTRDVTGPVIDGEGPPEVRHSPVMSDPGRPVRSAAPGGMNMIAGVAFCTASRAAFMSLRDENRSRTPFPEGAHVRVVAVTSAAGPVPAAVTAATVTV